MKPLFGTAIARSGGGLLSHFVSAHPSLMLARHPFLEVFRSLRDAVVRSVEDPLVSAAVPPGAPLQDYYFDPARLKALDAVLDAVAGDIGFDPAEREDFLARGAARCELESSDIALHFGRLTGDTYQEIFESALQVVRDVRGADARCWAGFQEPWIFEFFPMLARAFPDARFLVLFRDPRGAVASMKGIRRTDPEQVVNTVSYARHWRKYVALLVRFMADPDLASRMLLPHYEQLVLEPEKAATDLCHFLGVTLNPAMLDASNYVDFGKRGRWEGNSSYAIESGRLDPSAVDRWRSTISDGVHRLVDWTCAEDMRLVGYDPDPVAEDAALSTLLEESPAYSHWRSDFGDPVRDAGGELLRRSILGGQSSPEGVIRQCFLFSETLDRLTAGNQLVP